jgi:3-phenylpropionate/cinnamic acid dioxygenase small subunit
VTDEESIRRTLAEYAHLLDDGRFDEWELLYTADARFHVMGRTYEGRAAARGFMEQYQGAENRGKHICVNSVIDVDGGRATAVTDYIFITQAREILSAGRYHDVLVREPDRWRFAERRIVFMGDDG